MSKPDEATRLRRQMHEQRVTMRSQTKQLERLRTENKNLRAALAPFARLKPSFDEWRFAAHGRDELTQSRVHDDAFVLSREYPVAGDKTGDQRVTVAVRVADFREAHRMCNGVSVC